MAFFLQVKNVANTGILYWAGKLLALHETGLPTEMQLSDLSTVGQTNLNGTIDGKGPFAAHYRVMTQHDSSRR
jgi:all-trans-8'-apo-beta-carotenal 15,15'-oxygenase